MEPQQSPSIVYLSQHCHKKCLDHHHKSHDHSVIYQSQMQSKLQAVINLNKDKWTQCQDAFQKVLDQYLAEVTQFVKNFKKSFTHTRLLIQMLDQRSEQMFAFQPYHTERSQLDKALKEVLKKDYSNLSCFQAKLLHDKIQKLQKEPLFETIHFQKLYPLQIEINKQLQKLQSEFSQKISQLATQCAKPFEKDRGAPLIFSKIPLSHRDNLNVAFVDYSEENNTEKCEHKYEKNQQQHGKKQQKITKEQNIQSQQARDKRNQQINEIIFFQRQKQQDRWYILKNFSLDEAAWFKNMIIKFQKESEKGNSCFLIHQTVHFSTASVFIIAQKVQAKQFKLRGNPEMNRQD